MNRWVVYPWVVLGRVYERTPISLVHTRRLVADFAMATIIFCIGELTISPTIVAPITETTALDGADELRVASVPLSVPEQTMWNSH